MQTQRRVLIAARVIAAQHRPQRSYLLPAANRPIAVLSGVGTFGPASWTVQFSASRGQCSGPGGGRCSPVCRSTATTDGDAVTGEDIPQSFEESVQQACTALKVVVGQRKRKGKKGRKIQSFSIRRLCIEVPTADTGPATSVSLASFVVNALEDLRVEGGITVVFRDDSAAALGAQNLDVSAVALDQAPSQRLGSNLIIISPTEDQLQAVYELLTDHWRGRLVVLANEGWEGSVPEEYKDFAASFQVVYSFVPLAIQGLLGRQEGAVLRWTKQKGASTMWRIFLKQGDQFECVGQQATRPKPNELELAMYNASAAESPITKGMRFLKSLTSK